ncbi:hypothetical protein EI94DRAFT_1699069 [Lactarius quietus]|nr:hypothetical protein EI94DRAFT_1699069 [Lactarius quietus]
MSFLNFRSARRRAKKIVSLRHPRAPSPPTPGSFVSPDASEPTRESEKSSSAPRIVVDVTHRPLLTSDVLGIRDYQCRSPTSSRDFQGGLLSKSLPDDVELEQREARGLTAPQPRRTPKTALAPIKIPTTSHASKIQIQRSAGKSADPLGLVNPNDSPVLDDDNSSAVSGTTALIANVWYVQTDQSRDHRLSRRITRLDSATLPAGGYSLMEVGDSDVHPVPPLLSVVKSQTINDLSKDQSNVPSGTPREDTRMPRHCSSTFSHPISPIPELSTPNTSNPVTPDLVKDSSPSAEGGSSPQPQTSDSAPSAWSAPASNSSPPSGEDISMVLDVLSGPLPSSKLAPETTESSSLTSQKGVPASELDVNAPSGLRVSIKEHRRPMGSAIDTRRASSGSRSRPSFPSASNLILHPATLLSSDRSRISLTCRVSESAESARTEDTFSSALPSSLAKVHSHHISRLPYFPETATISSTFTSGGFPSWSDSLSPTSPDPLDNIIIADRSGTRRSKHSAQLRSSAELSVDTGSQLASGVHSPSSALSGSSQTFPETPCAFSPILSPNTNSTRPSPFPVSSKLGRTRSLRGRSSRVSQKSMIRRSKAAMGLRTHSKSSKAKLVRETSARFAAGEALGGSSSVPGCSKDVTATAIPGERSLTKEPISPRGLVVGDVFCPTSSQRGSKPWCHQLLLVLLLRFRFRYPYYPSCNLRGVTTPPSPQLHLPSPPHAPNPQPSPLSPSEEHGVPQPYRLHTPWHPVAESVAPTDATSTLPARAIFYPSDARRIPTRPPLPNGPRNPFRSASSSPHHKSHNRFRSNSSVESLSRATLMGARDLTNSSLGPGPSSGPKFQTSPPKFKAFTMDAAMWTFSSDDLQTIVSRAIKHSAEPSCIRLLTAQVAFTDVPAELERLVSLQNELKVCYKLQVRKRDALHKAITACAETMGSSSYSLHARLQELVEISATLDKIAEELYHARDQAAELSRMLAVHSGGALAMALRKLHASYLRRVAEIQSLHEQVFVLEAERDEAWVQAQEVARDLDDLNEALRTRDSSPGPGTPRPSNRSSLIMASRVSSARVSKQASQSTRINGEPNWFRPSELYVVRRFTSFRCHSSRPPHPTQLSSLNRINTADLSSRGSAHPSELSSSSVARALAQAQADLYGYLGIDDPDLRPPPLRRSSVAGSPSAASPGARDNPRRMSDCADWRAKGGSHFDRFQAFLENEPDALLATFHRLDD